MADPVIIPLDSEDAAFDLEVELGGRSYFLDFAWNTRGECWAMGVYASNGDPIVTGVRLVADWPVLEQFPDERLPTGKLMVMDTSGQGIDPGQDDLGTRVQLVYYDG